MIPQTLNGLRAIAVRLSIPWRGMWSAEVTLDLDDVALIPTVGPALISVGGMVLRGTVDPRGSGSFLNRASVRVIAGSGGWDKEVPAQHFANPGGGLLSSLVYAATAPLVLEPPPLDPLPKLLGKHFARTKGPASAIFQDRQWYVDPITGVVSVSDWLPLPQDPLWTIVDFDINQKRLSIISDNVILPGTLIADTRLGAKVLIARDVEQIFDANGSHAEVWVCDKPISRLQDALKSMVRSMGNTTYLKTYLYRFVLPVGGELALQGITEGAPDLNPIAQWTGLSGISASLLGNAALAPATEIVVGFTGGDPTQPFLCAFSPLAKPLALTLDAVGPINFGAPISPMALAIGVQAQIVALQAEIAAMGVAWAALGALTGPIAGAMVLPIAAPVAGAIAAGIVALAVGATATPSKKVFSE